VTRSARFFTGALGTLIIFIQPVFGGPTAPGIQNFYRLDNHVYRGAQPTKEGFEYLAKIGVKTVLDLRKAGKRSSAEEHVVTALGMRYVNVPMTGLNPPTQAQISRILALLESNAGGAVFVHCKAGHDRTGAVIAAYRIDHDHWTNASALREARARGMGFFEFPRQWFIRRFQPQTNAGETLAKSAGAPVRPSSAPAVSAPTRAVAQ
jgi:tyrosine-protein phosphatase SIW14